jgi:hypothetical protein
MRGDFGGRETNISKPPAEWLRTMKALCRFLRWSPPERIVFDYRLSDEFFNRHKGRSTEFGDRPFAFQRHDQEVITDFPEST